MPRYLALATLIALINDPAFAAPSPAAQKSPSDSRVDLPDDATSVGAATEGMQSTSPTIQSIACDGSDVTDRFTEMVAEMGAAGGGTITLESAGQTCRSKTNKTSNGHASISYIVTGGTKLTYENAPMSLALIRNDIINLQPAMTWAKYSQARSNDYTGFFYMFDDHNWDDRNNREKAALLAICSSADNSPGSSYFHDCVGGELDSDNPFGATQTRQWGLTANVGQKVAGGDGLMTGGEFDVTLIKGSIEQNRVDQSNSKIAISSVCVTQGVNCTAGLYFNLSSNNGGGRFYDGIVFKPAVFRRSAFCELAPDSTTSCQASLDTNGVFEARAILANPAGAPMIYTGSCAHVTNQAGGSAGSFSTSSICATGSTFKLVFPIVAGSGWVCNAQDLTSEETDLRETSYDTTSCTLKVTRKPTGAKDKIVFSATAF